MTNFGAAQNRLSKPEQVFKVTPQHQSPDLNSPLLFCPRSHLLSCTSVVRAGICELGITLLSKSSKLEQVLDI